MRTLLDRSAGRVLYLIVVICNSIKYRMLMSLYPCMTHEYCISIYFSIFSIFSTVLYINTVI